MTIQWTPELVDAIETAIATGANIVDICGKGKIFPHGEAAFWVHMQKDQEFQSRIARAMETRSDRDIENCRRIAMGAKGDAWQLAQLQIRTLQWEAGKRRPNKYSEKRQLEHSGRMTLEQLVCGDSDEEPTQE